MKLLKLLSIEFLTLMLLCFFSYTYAGENPESNEIKAGSSEKTLTLMGTLVLQNGTPAANVKVYMQKAFFPDNNRNRARTEFTTNDQGELMMPFGITNNHGNFSVTFHLQQNHLNFALSLRQGRASLDFPIIKIFELTEDAWMQNSKRVFNVGKITFPEGWGIENFERGSY